MLPCKTNRSSLANDTPMMRQRSHEVIPEDANDKNPDEDLIATLNLFPQNERLIAQTLANRKLGEPSEDWTPQRHEKYKQLLSKEPFRESADATPIKADQTADQQDPSISVFDGEDKAIIGFRNNFNFQCVISCLQRKKLDNGRRGLKKRNNNQQKVLGDEKTTEDDEGDTDKGDDEDVLQRDSQVPNGHPQQDDIENGSGDIQVWGNGDDGPQEGGNREGGDAMDNEDTLDDEDTMDDEDRDVAPIPPQLVVDTPINLTGPEELLFDQVKGKGRTLFAQRQLQRILESIRDDFPGSFNLVGSLAVHSMAQDISRKYYDELKELTLNMFEYFRNVAAFNRSHD
ncbi:Hypothetical predicted protein [Lecanosticta acicola]|uniref:Uncharacterized protein n=1 Tax=Lecanosticta acicola TaxID=111012 RepID=A0AAI8Z2X3_9PEZI|nr:Hypothetical predicted protein [Lecanosticta acicola]